MALPKEMKAIQITSFGKPYEINTVKTPSIIHPTDIILKVAVASNCHTDSMVLNHAFPTELPCIASHEGSGTIVSVGDDARKAGFSEGQRIMCGVPIDPCGACHDCLGPADQKHYCGKESHCGVTTNGFFAEYARADSRSSSILPDKVGFLSGAPLACAGRTIWRGVVLTGLKAGEWVAIVGSGGGLGHLGIQFAKAKGLKVIGVDARSEGLAVTQEYGADVVIDARQGKEHVVQQIQAVTNGLGADSTICISDHPDAASISCGATKMHGTMIMIAQPDTISIPFHEVIFRDVRIRGSLLCSQKESDDMLVCVRDSDIKVKTNVFEGLESIEQLVEMVHGGKIKGKAAIIVDQSQMDEEKKIGAKS